MVNKAAMLRFAIDAAKAETKKRGLDPELWGGDDLTNEATDIVERLFGAIEFDAADPKKPFDGKAIDTWRHRSADDLEHDWRSMRFDRVCFSEAAKRYLDFPWMKHEGIDWLILDGLTYAEYLATVDFFRANTMPIWKNLMRRTASKWYALVAGVVGLVKCLGWLFVAVVAYAFQWSVLAVFVGLTLCFQILRYRRNSKLIALTDAMAHTYAAVASSTISWRAIWEELATSRKAGVVWDGLAYRLVETRMSS